MTSELEEMNQEWLRALLEKDAAAVERLMADDYVYVAPTGQTLDREAILQIIRSPDEQVRRSRIQTKRIWVDEAGRMRPSGPGDDAC